MQVLGCQPARKKLNSVGSLILVRWTRCQVHRNAVHVCGQQCQLCWRPLLARPTEASCQAELAALRRSLPV